MKKIKTLLSCLFLGITTLNAQYSIVYDKSWVSETESSVVKAILDDENNIYLHLEGIQYTNGNQEYSYDQKIGNDNQNKWTQQEGINLYSRCIGFDDYGYPLVWGSDQQSNWYLVRLDKNSGERLDSLSFGAHGGGYFERTANGDYLMFSIHSLTQVRSNYTKRLDSDRNLIWESNGIPIHGDVFKQIGNRFYFHFTPDFLGSYPKIYYQNLNNGQVTSVYTFYSIPDFPVDAFFNEDTTLIYRGNGNILKLLNLNLSTVEILKQNATNDKYLIQHKNNIFPQGASYVNGVYTDNATVSVTPNIFNDFFNRKNIGVGSSNDQYFFKFDTGYGSITGQSNSMTLKIFNWDNDIIYEENFGQIVEVTRSNTGCLLLSINNVNEGINNARLVKICSSTASIENLSSSSFSIFPNPTNTTLTIRFEETAQIPTNISLFDLSGKMIRKQETNAAIETHIDVTKFAPGIYLLQAGSQTQRIVVE